MPIEEFKKIYIEPACKELARKVINNEPLDKLEMQVFQNYLYQVRKDAERS
jgi:hypothetical protein